MREMLILKPGSIITHRGTMKMAKSSGTIMRLDIHMWGYNEDEIKHMNSAFDECKRILGLNGYKFEMPSLSPLARRKHKNHVNKVKAHRAGNRLVVDDE